MSLKKVLGRAHVSLIMLQTLVVEIEATLNDRPLTQDSCDVTDTEPITLAHLLYGRRITSLPNRQVEDDEVVDPQDRELGSLQLHEKAFVFSSNCLSQTRWWICWLQMVQMWNLRLSCQQLMMLSLNMPVVKISFQMIQITMVTVDHVPSVL